MDSNILNERMGHLKEWEQPESINELLYNVLSSLNEYTQTRFNELEEEIRNEYANNGETPIIKSAVSLIENVDKHPHLYPVSTNPPVNRLDYVTTVFAECDFNTLQELMQNSYSAVITTGTENYTSEVRLRYSEKYLREVEWLYNVYCENRISWTTVNSVYFYKFLDVYTPADLSYKVTNAAIDFGEYEKYISYDKVLLWNIDHCVVKVSEYEAKPAYNTVLHEHRLRGSYSGENRYLVNPMGDKFVCFFARSGIMCQNVFKGLGRDSAY